jgi:hypothetical protein
MNHTLRLFPFSLLILIAFSCTCRSPEYREFYAHLHKKRPTVQRVEPSDSFLIILVDARHLDYSEGWKFLHSVAKHPSNGSKNGDVGHAWIFLQGIRNGEMIAIEGGHSGEKEHSPPRYFDGLMNYLDWGYAAPTPEQMGNPRYEPNPVKYLWTERHDGFFQKGSGGHRPTFAVKIPLTPQQFEQIYTYIQNYPYKKYGLVGPHCTTFVAEAARLAGISLETHLTMQIPPTVFFRRCLIRLWEDPAYSTFTFPTPDVLEKSLMEAVERGEVEPLNQS